MPVSNVQATMFLNDVTCIDHSWVNRNGQIVGDSNHLCVEVRGPVDEVEAVVVDFSQIKKLIKQIIDSPETGYDHKIWLIPGLSKFSQMKPENPENVAYHIYSSDGYMTASIEGAPDAFRVFSWSEGHSTKEDAAEFEIKSLLEKELHRILGFPVEIDVSLTTHIHRNSKRIDERTPTFFFTYTHGLKNSTSYGCQNLFHGHYSFIEFVFEPNRGIDLVTLQKMTREMNYTNFIWKDNVVSEDEKTITVSYLSPRGYFKGTFDKSVNKQVVVDTETTVENLVEYFVNKNRRQLKKLGVEKVYVSEGLAKGAVAQV